MAHLLIVGLDTGLRRGELLRLQARDVYRDVSLTVWEAKSGKPRTVPLTSRVANVLGIRMYRHPVGPLWSLKEKAVNDRWNRMRSAIGLASDEQFTPHAMRHTFCSRLAMRGANAMMIRDLAGHSTIAVTQRYMHLSPASLESAIALLDRPHATSDTCGMKTLGSVYKPASGE